MNAHSGMANPEHLEYFHFMGRIIGIALYHGKVRISFINDLLRKKLTLCAVIFCGLSLYVKKTTLFIFVDLCILISRVVKKKMFFYKTSKSKSVGSYGG